MIEKELANKLAGIAVGQIRAGIRYKQERMKQISKIEAAYLNQIPTDLPGRFNPAVPVMGGFLDALRAQRNVPTVINFDPANKADIRKAKRVNAMALRDAEKGNWHILDLDGVFLAGLSGIQIRYIASSSSKRGYRNEHRLVDHNHFYCQPKKGPDLELHRYNGEMNVWRSEHELNNSEAYDKEQVQKLISATDSEQEKFNEELYIADQARYKALKLDAKENYEGQKLFCLTNHYMEYEGVRYYLFMDYWTGTWVRAEKLEDMFSIPEDKDQPFWPLTVTHTHRHPLEMWSKGPGDDMLHIAEIIRVLIKMGLENLRKRTRTKKAVDSSMFPDLSEIEDDITEVVETNPMVEGKSIAQGVYEFRTDDNTSIIFNLAQYLNTFSGELTGITPGAKGAGSEDQATIYLGNAQQVATRMGLYSEFNKLLHKNLGERYLIGLQDHLTEGMAVKILGNDGYDWEEITKDDVHPLRSFDIRITGGLDEGESSVLKRKEKREALANLLQYQEIRMQMNPKKVIAEGLRAGGWADEDIKEFQDTETFGDRDLLGRAHEAIQAIVESEEEPPLVRRANEAFILEIIDYADDYADDLPDKVYERLYAYAYLHVPIVARNVARRVMILQSSMPQPETPAPKKPVSGGGAPGAPAAMAGAMMQ